jgi:hypothetical protein
MKTNGNVNDKRVVKLENVMAEDYIPFMSGRPPRDEKIGKDDQLNLKIMLNQCKTVQEFIAAF